MDLPGGAAGQESRPSVAASTEVWAAAPVSKGFTAVNSLASLWKFLTSQKILFYTLLSLLFKAEMLSVLYVGWIDGLVEEIGAKDITFHKHMALVWLLKPLFSSINDRFNFSLTPWELQGKILTFTGLKALLSIWQGDVNGRNLWVSAHSPKAVTGMGTRADRVVNVRSLASTPSGGTSIDSSLDSKNEDHEIYQGREGGLRNAKEERINVSIFFLVIAEVLIMVIPILVYTKYLGGKFSKWVDAATVVFTAAVVYTSSCADGFLSRHLRQRSEGVYTRAISARLALNASYALSIVVFFLIPTVLPSLEGVFAMNILFPLFLISNGLCTIWMLAEPTELQLQTYSGGFTRVKRTSPLPTPTATSLVESPREGIISFPTECILSLIVLFLMSFSIKTKYLQDWKKEVDRSVFFCIRELSKLFVSILLGLFVNIKVLMKLSMGVFGFCVFVLYASRSYVLEVLGKLAKKERVVVSIAVTILTSLIHQVLLTYSFLISLLLTQKGYEATFLSVPTFTVILASYSVEPLEKIVGHVGDKRFELTFYTFCLFVYCYSFSVLFNVNRKSLLRHYKKIHLKLSKSSGKRQSRVEWKDENLYTVDQGDEYSGTSGREPKSPWELQSDFSDESEA